MLFAYKRGGGGVKILASENPEMQEAVSSIVHDHQPGPLLSGVRHSFHTQNSIQASTQQHVPARLPLSFMNWGKRLGLLTEKFICCQIKISSSWPSKSPKSLNIEKSNLFLENFFIKVLVFPLYLCLTTFINSWPEKASVYSWTIHDNRVFLIISSVWCNGHNWVDTCGALKNTH